MALQSNSILADDLRNYFQSDQWPEIISVTNTEFACRLDLKINHDLHWLEGHFPEQPLVAGVVQTHWAAKFSQVIFVINTDVRQIDNLKFQEIILPGQTIQLSLDFDSEKNSVKFRFIRQNDRTETLFSEGKIYFIANNVLSDPS